jgi:rRNA processing protein Gar1
VHEDERERQRLPEPRFGSDGDHDEKRYGVRIVERACCRAMKRAGLVVEVKGRVKKVMAGVRAADTVAEERMEGMAGRS